MCGKLVLLFVCCMFIESILVSRAVKPVVFMRLNCAHKKVNKAKQLLVNICLCQDLPV